MKRKAVLIICCVLLGATIAVLSAFIIVALTKNSDKIPSEQSYFSESVYSPVSSEIVTQAEETPEPVIEKGLVISSPSSGNITTTEPTVNFAGTSDPDFPLTINGKEVERGEGGIFSVTENLNVGKNNFTFKHKDKTVTYSVTYRYVIISEYGPYLKQVYTSGSTFAVTAKARIGSTVKAAFNGATITLTPQSGIEAVNPDSEVFVNYIGSFTLPEAHSEDLSLGKVAITGTCNGKTETFYSGTITVKHISVLDNYDPNATPLGSRYVSFEPAGVAEIIAYEAETFNAYSTDDLSRPTNNYLPKGTVDYCDGKKAYYGSGENQKEFTVLRCGYEVYTNKKNPPKKQKTQIINIRNDILLPDHNEITFLSFENGTNHTTLKLGTNWKAPFYFDMVPQSYTNPAKQDYTISDFTCGYIDITFCYATVLNGEIKIPEDNPLFSSAAIWANQTSDNKIVDHTLRLYLKKQGAFYGWDANYDSDGNLVFEFLNPAKVSAADNAYGADLTGVRILIDVGHGGDDCGAPGFDYKNHSEAIQNLFLANKIKAQLESIGATVYMTRTDNSTSATDDKIPYLKSLKPDYCIAIHHNSSTSSKPNGFGSYYSQPFSKKAAEFVYYNTMNTGIYDTSSVYNVFTWHYYFMARSSYCPVVLTENGYISNSSDYWKIIDGSVNDSKAIAITKGIAQYFLSIQ